MNLLPAFKSNTKRPKHWKRVKKTYAVCYSETKRKMIENFHICGKWLKSLEDLASAFSILPAKTPHRINHAIDEDGNQWYLKPLRKFQNKTTRITCFVYRSTCWKTLQQGMGYSLNFFRRIRKFSCFIWERNITFWKKLKSPMWKVIAMLLMTVSLVCSVLLLLSTNHITKKHEAVNSVKAHHSTGKFILTSYIYKQWLILPYKKMISKNCYLPGFLSLHRYVGQTKLCSIWKFLCHQVVEYGTYLFRVKDAARLEGSFFSRSRSLSLENFGWPMRRANHQ